MNFDPATHNAAANYADSVRASLDNRLLITGMGTLVRALQAGVSQAEIEALAKLAGHPFASELPDWMLENYEREIAR